MGTPKLEHIPRYTYADYSRWEGRWELINGVPYAMTPSPSILHQRISQKIAYLLEKALAGCPSCHALLPVDWKVDEDTIVQPDNLVICYPPPDAAYITRAPALIFEILSKSTSLKDTSVKLEIYEREGVRYYCMVYPEERTVKIFELRDGKYIKNEDVSEKNFPFMLQECSFDFPFDLIWP